jgi:hypothetical protein
MAAREAAILPCNCSHDYQDEKYGRGKRVHNPTMNGQFRCTICSSVKGTAKAVETTKAKKK